MGWSGEKNGELLTLCEAEGFDVLLIWRSKSVLSANHCGPLNRRGDSGHTRFERAAEIRRQDSRCDRPCYPGQLPGRAIKLDGCAATETEQADSALGKSGASRTIEQIQRQLRFAPETAGNTYPVAV
jgi:hypothetical protein